MHVSAFLYVSSKDSADAPLYFLQSSESEEEKRPLEGLSFLLGPSGSASRCVDGARLDRCHQLVENHPAQLIQILESKGGRRRGNWYSTSADFTILGVRKAGGWKEKRRERTSFDVQETSEPGGSGGGQTKQCTEQSSWTILPECCKDAVISLDLTVRAHLKTSQWLCDISN